MKRVLVTYSDSKYIKAKEKLIKSANKYLYFDSILSYSPDDIDTQFYEENKNILNIKRGNGLWLWKPYFIKNVLDKLSYGDLLFYCDSGAFFIRNPRILENEFTDIFVSNIPLIEKQFTRTSVFNKFNCSEYIKNSNQIIATYIIIKKTKKSEKIVDEWLNNCRNEELLCPPESIRSEDKSFISHREDQSILSVICKKNGIIPFSDITHRKLLPYTYFRKKYLFKKTTSKKCKIVLYLHKLPSPTFSLIMKQIIRQLCLNIYYLIFFKKDFNYEK